MRRLARLCALAVVLGGALAVFGMLHPPTHSALEFAWSRLRGGYTLDERIEQYRRPVAARLAPAFAAAGVAYPPHEIAYIAFKDKRVLEVYARNSGGQRWRYVKQYPVLRASGVPGPKLVEGDKQVPEGVYRVAYLNPNSRFHLSLGLNYPNDFDRSMARVDGRTRLGGDIMIHGSNLSIGCLAMGDEAAEDLFILAALATTERTRIVVSPTDFRTGAPFAQKASPAWAGKLYDGLRSELRQYRREPL